MIPKERVLDKLDSLLRANDYAGAKRLLQYWLSEAECTGDRHGSLLMKNELVGLCRKPGEKEQALQYAQDTLDLVGQMHIEDGRIDAFVKERYASFDSPLGQQIRRGEATLEQLARIADEMGAPALPASGRQEYLQSIMGEILFR